MVRNPEDDPRVYAALAMPNAALSNGGVEILRAGIIDDGLHVQARRAFKNPKQWGEVLADITERIASLYAAETTRSREDVIDTIRETFFAELVGAAPGPKSAPRRSPTKKKAGANKPASRKPTSARKSASQATRKTKRKR